MCVAYVGCADLERLRDAAQRVFQRNGLGVTEIVAGGRTCRAAYSDEIDVRVVPPGQDSPVRLEWLVADELNRPFARPMMCPIRFALLAGQDDSHFLVATYDHWTADSVASRLLLRQILGHYLACQMPERQQVLTTYDGTFRHVFPQHLRWSRLGSAGVARDWPDGSSRQSAPAGVRLHS